MRQDFLVQEQPVRAPPSPASSRSQWYGNLFPLRLSPIDGVEHGRAHVSRPANSLWSREASSYLSSGKCNQRLDAQALTAATDKTLSLERTGRVRTKRLILMGAKLEYACQIDNRSRALARTADCRYHPPTSSLHRSPNRLPKA